MKPAHFQAYRFYQVTIALTGWLIPLLSLWLGPENSVNPKLWVVFAFLVGLLVQFPTSLFHEEISLVHVVTLGSAFIIGPAAAVWTTAAGILGGFIVRWVIREKRSWRRFTHAQSWIKIGYKIGIICIPLSLAFFISDYPNGGLFDQNTTDWISVTILAAIVTVLHGILMIFGFLFRQRISSYPKFENDLLKLIAIELLSIPFVVVTVNGYLETGPQILLIFWGATLIIAILLSRMNSAKIEQERRERELSTLHQISHTLRSTIDLNELLPVIQQQVMELLEVNNFYIALYDRENEELWYPFAVKFGQQQHWRRRQMTNRLTDRVIKEEKPLLLTPENQSAVVPIGLPPSEEHPTSWLGVPLISSERTIGCLAVFTLEPGSIFTSADTDVLTILSGQVSVAIENALLYQQAQQRARQLETINQLTRAMTASLNLDEVLSQVCNSVALVVGGQRSAVFLLDPGGDTVSLAHAHGLEESFNKRNASFSIAHSRRTRCLRTGRPVIIPDIKNSSLSLDLIQHFRADKIQALADFPLITPDGQIGFLSVYFGQPHTFSLEETGILQTFASQAALAMANARLHARTDAALARRVNQLTTLEAVGRELSAATHSDRLYPLILDYALEMTNSCCGSVAIYDLATKKIEVRASQGYEAPERSFSVDSGITGRVARTRKIANVPDVSLDPDYIDLGGGETHSQLSVPIIHEDRSMGVISLESTDFNAYSESEEAFVTQLANQAAIDIINAELYHETQRRLREQSTLYQVSTRLVSAVSPHHVAQTITQAINAVLQPLTTGIYNWSEAQNKYHLLGQSGEHLPAEIPALNITLEQDSGQDFRKLKAGDPLVEILALDYSSCQTLTFPLEMTRRRPGFVILQLPTERVFDENEIILLKAIFAQGSIALQNAHYFQEATNGRDRLTAILNSIEEGILMVDIDGHVLLANEPIRILTGLPLERFLSSPLHELPEETLETIGYKQAEIKKLLEALKQKHIPLMPKTVVEIHAAQNSQAIERFTTPVWGQDGSPIGWMLLLRDITEEYEIEQTREAITETIVHDLRSPMSAIVGALDLLSDCLYGPDEHETDQIVIQQSLLVAQRSANRILDLTEALLEIARLQSGRMELNIKTIDLSLLISDLLIEFTTQANDDSVIIRTQIPNNLPLIQADKDKLIRILTNLVDNAIKFTPEGEHVTISANLSAENMIAINVQDSGPGVPEDYREKIFDRFVQVPGHRPRRRGTGLGLTFCRLAVEAHGGRIWVETLPKGGSIFTFTLPIGPSPKHSTAN